MSTKQNIYGSLFVSNNITGDTLNLSSIIEDNSLTQLLVRDNSSGIINYRDVNSVISAATSADTFVTGFTYDNVNTFTISRNDDVDLTSTISILSGITYYGDGSNLSGITTTDTFVTGGTYDNVADIITFTNNSGGTFDVTGITDNFVVAGSYSDSTDTISLLRQDGSFVNITGVTDNFVSGGTYNSGTNEINFVGNSSETTFDVDLSSLISSVSGDTFVVSGNADVATSQLTFTYNTGGTFTVTNSAALFSDNDINVTGGTYDNNTGCVTFTTNSGTSFDVCGFVTGLTDTFTTGSTLVGETIQFDSNILGPNYYNVSLSPVLSGKTDNSTFNSYTSNTETILNSKVSGATNLSTTGLFAQKNGDNLEFKGLTSTGGTVTITNDSTTVNLEVTIPSDTNTFVTGGTYNESTDTITFTNNTGGTFNVTGITDTFTTGGTYDNGTALVTFTRNDGNSYTLDLSTIDVNDTFSTGGTVTQSATSGSSEVIVQIVGNDGFTPYNITGLTDTFINDFSISSNTFTISQNDGSSFVATADTIDLASVLSAVTFDIGTSGSISATTFNGGTFNGTFVGDGSGLTGITDNDTFVTGTTFASNQITLTRNDNVDVFSLSGGSNVTLSETATNDILIDVSLPPSMNTYVTGGTYNESTDTITLTRNDAVTVDITGVTDTFTTGSTYDNGTALATFTKNDGTTYTLDLSTIDVNDTFVTGFTYDDNNNFTISRNDGVDLSTSINIVTGLTVNGTLSATTLDGDTILSGGTNLTTVIESLDTYVTGGTVSVPATDNTNSGTIGLFYKNSDGTPRTLPFEDTYTTGATYDNGTALATFNRNDGNSYTLDLSTIDVNDTFVTGFTYNDANTLTISRNDDVDLSTSINTMTGLTVNGTLVVDTLSATTYTGLTLNDLDDVTTNIPSSPDNTYQGELLYFDAVTNQWVSGQEYGNLGEVTIWGKKGSAGTIAKGLPVYIVGFDNDIHEVELANATTATTMPVIGFTAEEFDNAGVYPLVTFGKITGLDTTSGTTTLNPNGETWEVNDVLYMAKTDGGLTKFRPTGTNTQIQRIAKILKVGTTDGQIFIFNTARTAGLPNLTSDYLWVGNGNDTPQEVIRTDVGITTTGFTYNDNNTFTITDDNGGSLSSTINQMSGLTINGNLVVTGTTNISGITTVDSTLKVDGNVNITSNSFFFQGTSVGGGNVSLIGVDSSDVIRIGNLGFDNYIEDDTTINGVLTADTIFLATTPTLNNSGTDILVRNSSTGEVEYRPVSGITPDTDTFVSGGTYNDTTNNINFSGNSAETTFDVDLTSLVSSVSANTFVISGTYVDSTDTLALLRNDGNFVNITGITDTFTTGATYDNGTALATFDRNDGTSYTLDLSTIDVNDTFVTGTTFNSNQATVTRNDGIDVLLLTGGTNVTLSNPSTNQIKIDVASSTPTLSVVSVTGSTYSATTSDDVIGFDTSSVTPTLFLPDSTSSGTKRYEVKDIGVNSRRNPITIQAAGSDTIITTSVVSSFELSADGGAVILVSTGAGQWWQM